MIRNVCFTFLLLISSYPLHCQGTISVDAVSAMPVCGVKDSAQASPCATAPTPLSKVSPSYPDSARHNRKEGTVTLGLTVTKDGSVTNVHVVKGVEDEIDQAAVKAVNQWKFNPGTYQGNAVDVELTVTVNFRLSTNSQQPPLVGNLQEQNQAGDTARNLYSDAVEAYNRGDYATAANLMRSVTAILPQNGNAWNELGRDLLAMNELDAAAQAFKTAIEKDPASENAYNNLGLVYWRQRKYQDATAQFRQQIVVNPDDHYAHRHLGMMLRDEQRCSEAMPELQKALSLSPDHPGTLLAEGECDLDLGNRAKGVSELEQAIGASSSPGILNGAAYVLAKRNIEISMAQKWSEMSLTIENPRLQNISLDHLTPEQLNYASWIANYWDTRGWIYFLEGDNSNARSFVEAAWSLRTDPTIGYHLGRIYEGLGRSEQATRVYAMAIASADGSTRETVDLADMADAKKQLKKLADENADTLVKRAVTDLSERNVVLIPNAGAVSASADFAVRLSAAVNSAEFRQLGGDKVLAKFTDSLRAAKLPVSVPQSSGIELALRATLTCHSEEPQCRFAFFSPEEAVNLARNEMALASAVPATSAARDPHIYDDPSLGMRISLPDEWRLVKIEPGSFSRPRNAMFGKSGSTAMFVLTRERFEGSLELYQKMLDSSFSNKNDFKRSGEEAVKRDGLAGVRWNVSWNQNGIDYRAVIEMFGMEDDYYRITTLAPKEVYDRYSMTFEDVLHSVQFPMLRANPQLLDLAK